MSMAARGGSDAEKLAGYRGRREFTDTPEPAGAVAPETPEGRAMARFVVHEHHARRLHWDLRLEHDGVLASWAIPNGIPDDPKRNRKAIHVEDHPLEYIDFHGEIPSGNYGAGEVSIWDQGAYECEKWRVDEIIIVFHGERLRGRYALFQTGRDTRDWMIHRMDPPIDPDAEPMPDFIPPMLAKLSTLPADEQGWAFEVKWDGVRAIARSEPGRMQIFSRNGNEITRRLPGAASAEPRARLAQRDARRGDRRAGRRRPPELPGAAAADASAWRGRRQAAGGEHAGHVHDLRRAVARRAQPDGPALPASAGHGLTASI